MTYRVMHFIATAAENLSGSFWCTQKLTRHPKLPGSDPSSLMYYTDAGGTKDRPGKGVPFKAEKRENEKQLRFLPAQQYYRPA